MTAPTGLTGLNLNLFDTPRKRVDAPVASNKKTADDFIAIIKQIRAGVDIMVCSVSPPPISIISDAHVKGLPLFCFDEIEQMHDIDNDLADTILAIKTIFPGCHVKDIIHQVTA